jgi:quinol monooxygenase YgiN
MTAAGALAAEPQLAHMVYFTLKENSENARQQLVAGCHKHLSGHDGAVYFSVGVLAQDLNRDVNDRDFNVALHLVFKNKAAHDAYIKHPRHLKFIEENSQLWSKVRVFDSYLTGKTK